VNRAIVIIEGYLLLVTSCQLKGLETSPNTQYNIARKISIFSPASQGSGDTTPYKGVCRWMPSIFNLPGL